MTSVPSGSVRNGTITSSTSMPMRSFDASPSVSRPSTRTSSPSCTIPTP